MAEKKSILKDALLDAKKIQEALNANTKEILRSVAREEIDSVVKESLVNEEFEEEEVETADDAENSEMDADAEMEDDTVELGDTSSDNIPTSPEVGTEMGDQEMGMDADALGDEEEIDMTTASDDDVIAIYKKLSGDDEIEIVGDEIHLSISEPGEYVVKTSDLGLESEEEETEEEETEEEESEEESEGEGFNYEISMSDEESEEEESEEETEKSEGEESEEEETEEEELDERITVGNKRDAAARANIGQPKGAGARLEESNTLDKKLVSETLKKYNTLLTESNNLKAENEEFRKALKKFRSMLVETVVFNSNLSYVTKLFMEHSTTKEEKKTIIARFDEEVSNLNESKRLYRSIAKELSSRKPISESIENKIIKEATTSTSKQLNESTAYVDPSTQRIKDLISRVEKR